jgi:hypothetical protein
LTYKYSTTEQHETIYVYYIYIYIYNNLYGNVPFLMTEDDNEEEEEEEEEDVA